MRTILLSICVASIASAQRGTPAAKIPDPSPLHFTDSVFLDAATHNFGQTGIAALNARGQLLVSLGYDELKVFGPTGKQVWSIRLWQDAEIRRISSMGWRDGHAWIADVVRKEIVVFNEWGRVSSSTDLPTMIRPTFSNRRTSPAFVGLRSIAWTGDGSFVGVPYGAVVKGLASEYDTSKVAVLRTDHDGIILSKQASLDKGSTDHPMMYDLSADGSRVAVVRLSEFAGPAFELAVLLIGSKSDTLVAKRFAIPVVLSRKADSGNVLRSKAAYPPLTGLLFGADNSVWISFRETVGTIQVRGFTPLGAPLGITSIAVGDELLAADATSLWVMRPRGARRGLTRYTFRPQ